MQTAEAIVRIISLLAAAIGLPAIIGVYLTRKTKREEQERLDDCKSMSLILRGIRKTGQLSYATALAVQGKKINGEMDTAMEGYKEYMDELEEHLANQAFKK
jgi:hypothetical protein